MQQTYSDAHGLSKHDAYTLVSYAAEDAKADAIWMKASLQAGLDVLDLSQSDRQRFWQHMHFATTSVAETRHWLPDLLAEWKSPRKVVHVSSPSGALHQAPPQESRKPEH